MRKLKSLSTANRVSHLISVIRSPIRKISICAPLLFLLLSLTVFAESEKIPAAGQTPSNSVAPPNAQGDSGSFYETAATDLFQHGRDRVVEAQKHLCAIHPAPAKPVTPVIAPSYAAAPNDCPGGKDKAAESIGNIETVLSAEKASLAAADLDAKNKRELAFLKLYDSTQGFGGNAMMTVEQMQKKLESYKSDLEKYKMKVALNSKRIEKILFAKQSLQSIASGQIANVSAEAKLALAESLTELLASNEKESVSLTSMADMYTQQLQAMDKNHPNAAGFANVIKSLKAKIDANGEVKPQMLSIMKILDGAGGYAGTLPPLDLTIQSLQQQAENVEAPTSSNEIMEIYKKKILSLEETIATKKQEDAAAALVPAAGTDQRSVADQVRDLEAKVKSNGTVESVSHNSGFQSCGLSTAEVVAIIWYCGSGYGSLNGALRSTDPAVIEKYKPFKDTLNAALKKLSPYEGYTTRGSQLPDSIRAQHTVGNVVNYSAFTSTSLTHGFGGTDVFIIKSKTGRYVGSYSQSYSENEVLFASDTQFKILSVRKENGINQYVMEEVTN